MSAPRSHVSKYKAVSVYGVNQRDRSGDKPYGFWYEVDGSWQDWCASNQADWLEGRWLHKVTLGNERILMITNLADFDAFSQKCGSNEGLPGSFLWPKDYYIDWQQVAEEYDGIEIAPYFWERRMTCSWYYTWDVASGCIWRPQGVAVSLIGEVQPVLVDSLEE